MKEKVESIRSVEKDGHPADPVDVRTVVSTDGVSSSDILKNSKASPWTFAMMKLYFFCLIAMFTCICSLYHTYVEQLKSERL